MEGLKYMKKSVEAEPPEIMSLYAPKNASRRK